MQGGARLEVQVIPQCRTKSQLWAILSSESQGKLKREASGDLLQSNLVEGALHGQEETIGSSNRENKESTVGKSGPRSP